MNTDQVKGVAKNIEGKFQEIAGEIMNDKDQQIKGLNKQVEGKVFKTLGDLREYISGTKS